MSEHASIKSGNCKIHSLESIDWHVDEIEKMTIAPKIRSMVPNKFQRSVSCYEKNT